MTDAVTDAMAKVVTDPVTDEPPGSARVTSVTIGCSDEWDAAGLAAWGSATRAGFVVALEQEGPWGAKAITESRLDPQLGAALTKHLSGLGGTLLLIRTPAERASVAAGRERHRVLVARTGPRGWLVRADVTDPAILLQLTADHLTGTADDPAAGDPAAGELGPGELGPGDPAGVASLLGGQLSLEPALLVCTNGRRDACCARRGRPVAAQAARAYPGQVWEVTHTGGHRFAPTGILLPWGRMLARLDAALAGEVLAAASGGALAAGALGPAHDRGAMHLEPRDQVAESFVRAQLGLLDLSEQPSAELTGRAVVVEREGPTLRTSCLKAPLTTSDYLASWAADSADSADPTDRSDLA